MVTESVWGLGVGISMADGQGGGTLLVDGQSAWGGLRVQGLGRLVSSPNP